MIQKHVYYLTIMYRYVKFKNVYHLEIEVLENFL